MSNLMVIKSLILVECRFYHASPGFDFTVLLSLQLLFPGYSDS